LKILNPNNTLHTIILQPRFAPVNVSLVLELTNKVSKVVDIVPCDYSYIGAVLTLFFNLTVLESDQYLIELSENDNTIFRGSIFCTAQNPQDYKLTKDKIIYV